MSEQRRDEVTKGVLLVGSVDSLMQVAPILSRSELEVEAVPEGSEAARQLGQGDFQAVVVRAALEDSTAAEAAEKRAHREGKAFGGVVVLHGGGDRPTGLEQSESFRLLDTSVATAGEILEAVSSILGLETRHGARLEIELKVAMEEGLAQVPCVTRNVSHSGILVESASPPEIGTKISFEIELRDGALIYGRAETVRHRLSDTGEVRYAGLRFLTMDADSGTRWHRFIEELEAS